MAATLGALYQEYASDEVAAHTEYQTDPIGWAIDKLGIPEHTIRWDQNAGYDVHQWDGTANPLVAIADGLVAWQNVGCESGTGTGKSYWMAVLILWFLACHEDARVFTFAPKEDQLRLYIWMEIGRLWPRFAACFPDAKLTDLTIRMRGGSDEPDKISWGARGYAVGISAGEQVSTKASGMHAEHLLLVYEETPGIPMPVLEAGRNTCTAPHNLRVAIGNPNHQLDSLHRFCLSTNTVHVRMSALDHPNVVADDHRIVPGAVSRQKIEERRIEYGEDDPVFLSRIRGLSPDQPSNALIRLEWLKAAQARYDRRVLADALPTKVTGKGVDVANSARGDRGCIVDFADNAVIRIDAFPCPDANALGAQVVAEARKHGLEMRRVGVDAIGVGAGTINEARRQGAILTALYAGGKPMRMVEKMPDGRTQEWSPDVNLFENLRAQMYWQAREDLRSGVLDLPFDKELWEELTSTTFEDDNKVVRILPKDDLRALLGRSPDKADAFVMGNWVRARAFVPAPAVDVQGRSLGYDYDKRQPRQRPNADEEMAQMLKRATPNPLANRYRVPVRRG